MLQDDVVLLRLPPALGLAGGGGGVDALAHVHGHLLLFEDGLLGAEGLHAQVGGLVADAPRGEELGSRTGEGGRVGQRRGGEEVGFGEEAAELEVLGE